MKPIVLAATLFCLPAQNGPVCKSAKPSLRGSDLECPMCSVEQPASVDRGKELRSFCDALRKALLIGQGAMDQVRELPELQEPKADKIVREVGVAATDRLYESDRSYADTVRFFEHQVERLNGTILRKNITTTSTAWTLRRPNDKLIDIVVRNTVPPTFEIVEAVEERK